MVVFPVSVVLVGLGPMVVFPVSVVLGPMVVLVVGLGPALVLVLDPLAVSLVDLALKECHSPWGSLDYR